MKEEREFKKGEKKRLLLLISRLPLLRTGPGEEIKKGRVSKKKGKGRVSYPFSHPTPCPVEGRKRGKKEERPRSKEEGKKIRIVRFSPTHFTA